MSIQRAAITILISALAPAAAAAGEQRVLDGPPFRVGARYGTSGDAALVIEDANGRRVRNLFAQTLRAEGQANEAWDLKDEAGNYVAPGQYAWKTIAGPQLALEYGITPYPNLQNFFPERMPWLIGHAGEHGWLSDHNPNFASTTFGDYVFFASTMAEAGSSLALCDLEGRRLWGRHDFGPWTGVYRMAADAESLFVLDCTLKVRRIDAAARKETNSFNPNREPDRRGYISSMAAHDGKVYLAYSLKRVIDNSATADAVDLANSLPTPPDRSFLQLLRIDGDPPGGDKVNPQKAEPQGNGRLYLESQPLGGKHVSVIAFRQPVPLGSIVFPWPAAEGKLQFAALKPDAPYPPRPERDEDWTPFESSGGPGWNCVAAPPKTMTRAVRVLFEPKEKDGKFWRLDGLRLLNRRYSDAARSARVRVSSGEISANGEWDAKRTDPIAPDKPGIYLMEWKENQKLNGLAFKEVDGATAEIDVWQGPVSAELPMDGDWTLDHVFSETRQAPPVVRLDACFHCLVRRAGGAGVRPVCPHLHLVAVVAGEDAPVALQPKPGSRCKAQSLQRNRRLHREILLAGHRDRHAILQFHHAIKSRGAACKGFC
ncbi:MAG TPA: hypothetical protein VM141_00035 [Planctomycetota bacterium]|nr:hypothetical protein [Planctomycetota bacterium]